MRPLLFAAILLLTAPFGVAAGDPRRVETPRLISRLLEDEEHLKGMPFTDVVKAATGKSILPVNPTNEVDRALLAKIGSAMDQVLKQLNAPDGPAQKERRINEVSAHFEKAMLAALNDVPGFTCGYPKTATGQVQRSGYPDLRLMDTPSGRVIYLDPKLLERGSRDSSFRTFYFEPKKGTNKILDNAHHLIVGFEHDGKKDGRWKFLSWELVDLSKFNVRLKAEFQGSNHDLYRQDAIVGTSRK